MGATLSCVRTTKNGKRFTLGINSSSCSQFLRFGINVFTLGKNRFSLGKNGLTLRRNAFTLNINRNYLGINNKMPSGLNSTFRGIWENVSVPSRAKRDHILGAPFWFTEILENVNIHLRAHTMVIAIILSLIFWTPSVEHCYRCDTTPGLFG